MNKEYIYYWYHHMMSNKERKEIEKIFKDKDYFAFIEKYKEYSIKSIKCGKYYEEFESWIPMIYFPDTIDIVEGDILIEKESILDRNSFKKITCVECECG